MSDATRAAAGQISGLSYGARELHWLRNVSEPIETYLVVPLPDVSTGALATVTTAPIAAPASLLCRIKRRLVVHGVPA